MTLPQEQEINPAPFEVDITINDKLWNTVFRSDLLQEKIYQWLDCARHKVCPWLENAEISIVLMNDQEIQQLNHQYRGKNQPTNVLSFGNLEHPLSTSDMKKDQPVLLGDILLSLETLQKEAREQQKSFDNHMAHMVVHGFLHLLGYDHIDDNDAAIMESLETGILKEMNIPNPYKELAE